MAWSVHKAGRIAVLSGLCGLLPTLIAAGAESYTFRSSRVPGSATKVQAQLEVAGDLKVVAEGKVRPLKMGVQGKLAYEERLLDAAPGDRARIRSARYYNVAEAEIKIEDGGEQPKLRGDRRLIIADASPLQTILFSPQGPLTREELDLIEAPGNSLWVEKLLPSKPVKIGDRWQHSDQLMASLLGLDAVSQSAVVSELKTVDSDNARFEMLGNVHGAAGGVATDIEIKAKYRFDRRQQRVAWVGLLIKENRSVGHVAAGLDVVARMQIHLTPLETSSELSDELLNRLALDSAAQPLSLECPGPASKFRFQHGRGWHVMSDLGEVVTLRYVDRGELVAQCNVSALPDTDPGKHPALAKFQQDIQRSLDKNFGQFVQASEAVNSAGHVIYRVVAEGKVSELPIQWRYYLVADDQGHQAVFAFTLESELASELGDAEQELISTTDFAARPGAAGRPTPAAAQRPTPHTSQRSTSNRLR